jgi:hypothetical protein
MKNLLFGLAALLSLHAYSQTDAQIDSLCRVMCNTMMASTAPTLQEKVDELWPKHMEAFFSKYPVRTDAEATAMEDKLFTRLQKNCTWFTKMLQAEDGTDEHGEWQLMSEPPKSTVKKKECRTLTDNTQFFYYEGDGKLVDLTIKNGLYEETFEDGTYSRLTFKWVSDCEFELTFIESNHSIRKNLSKKDDVYHYSIYGTTVDGYKIWSKANDGVIMAFPLHVKK